MAKKLRRRDNKIKRKYEDLLTWAIDTLVELNVSNYNHDDVCRANSASVEVIIALQNAIGKDIVEVLDEAK